jgi:hypothetical protein
MCRTYCNEVLFPGRQPRTIAASTSNIPSANILKKTTFGMPCTGSQSCPLALTYSNKKNNSQLLTWELDVYKSAKKSDAGLLELCPLPTFLLLDPEHPPVRR